MWNPFSRKEAPPEPAPSLSVLIEDDGVSITSAPGDRSPATLAARALLEQLADEGLAEAAADGHRIDWLRLYTLLDDDDARDELRVLNLPPIVALAPRLASRGSLTDPSFAVLVDGWSDAQGRPARDVRLSGGVLMVEGQALLLQPRTWRLIELVRRFARRAENERNESAQRRAWGELRREALACGGRLDDFLYRTVVLTPDRLQLALRRSEDGGLVEVEPWFDGAPIDWLAAFDRSAQVRDRYDLPTPEGIVQVMVEPEVATVLREIKRMPGRRVVGERAQAFLLNPVAALGPDAERVVDEGQFEEAKREAGISFERFTAITPETHGPGALGLLIISGEGDKVNTTELALSEEDVREFVAAVRTNLERGLQLCSWDGWEFELDGDSALQCDALSRAIERREAQVITHGEVYDLAGYSDRVEGIGQQKAFYSPHIARRSDGEGWFPENLVPMIGWTDAATERPVVMPLTEELSSQLRDGLDEARRGGADTVPLAGCPGEIPIREAEAIVATFARVDREVAEERFAPDAKPRPGPKPTLILKGNIDQLDYREERLAALAEVPGPPRLPRGIRPEVQLKQHQLLGLAWMQRLLTLAPNMCRGALLADDMGLGKTLQLLCLIARAREDDPAMSPALVVAPLSLLENWREEAVKFLEPGTLRILTAYGDDLAALRVDRVSVDEQLRREGLVRFLKPGWRGDADLVLTTYEMLRDLEFSFARERWSIMVCDEAQKIKNPNAAMTRAAKKQQATFRIACTGTPVENSLVDLWCLFDFVQPGLLGALNEFGANYRRPIEAEGEDDRAKVEELRALVAPQLLRRMKVDVATDLRPKTVDEGSRSLPMSAFQRGLYVGSLDAFRQRSAGSAPGGHLALLHRLRLICSNPDAGSDHRDAFDGVEAYRARSPKLDWLIEALERVRDRGEKAIVFCEFKSIQRLVRHYVQETFAIRVDVINGDTSAVAGAVDSRQRKIRAFQEAPGFGVIILSPVAVGFGVNMQAANHVVHFTRTWNPAKEDQATDRAYRIGQTREVHVYYPTVAAPDFKTFDVKLDELLERKRELAGDMLNGTGEIGGRDFDIEELRPT